MVSLQRLSEIAKNNNFVLKKEYKKSELLNEIKRFLPKSFQQFYYDLLMNNFRQSEFRRPEDIVGICLQNMYENRPVLLLPALNYDFRNDYNTSPPFSTIVENLELRFSMFEIHFEGRLLHVCLLNKYKGKHFYSEQFIIRTFESDFVHNVLNQFYEKKQVKLRCDICNRVEGNPFKTKYFYDENRALEIELHGKTKIHECKLQAVAHRQPSPFYQRATYMRNMCEICITRIQITDISYMKLPNQKTDYRFLRKNELITDDFVPIEDIKIIDRQIQFQNGASIAFNNEYLNRPNHSRGHTLYE